MSDVISIKIVLSSTHWDSRYPGARVSVDDIVIFENIIAEKTTIEWAGNLSDGKHTVSIEMYNKNPGDTVLDENGIIVKDVLLNIETVEIDGIALGQLLYEKPIYYPKDKDAPEIVKRCLNLGWNGSWMLEFTTPSYLWFLENF